MDRHRGAAALAGALLLGAASGAGADRAIEPGAAAPRASCATT